MPSRMVTVPVLGGLFLLAVIAGAAALTAPGSDFTSAGVSSSEPLESVCVADGSRPAFGAAAETPPDVTGFVDCLQATGYGDTGP